MPQKKHHKSQALASRTRFFRLFLHTTTVALHSGTWFSTVPHIIPASQVLPKNATAGFGQGFPERASAAQPLPPYGIAYVRLMPGVYQFSRIYISGYKSEEPRETFTLEYGGIKRLKYQLTSQPTINGMVRDENGKPVQDTKLMICPMGGRDEIRSDVEGKFKVSWDPGMWGSGERETVFCLVALHEKRNLAVAMEISQDTKTVDIKLRPGVTFTGRVVDTDGKGIPDAQVRVMLRVSNWGSPLSRELVKADENGNYEFSAIPAGHNYSIYASAEGYGQKDINAHADNAVDNRLNIETLTLPPANLSVSGQIVDAQGKAVSGARVEGSGEDQPRLNTLTDEQGNFTLDGLCEGTVYIRADVSRHRKRLSARVHTDAGASGISIVVREGRPVSYYIRAKTYEQIIQSSEKVIAGVALDENGSPVAGVPVSVCCKKRQREEGKFSWTYSSYSTLSDITDEQGRFAIELEEDAEYSVQDERGVLPTKTVDLCLMSLLISSIDSQALVRIAIGLSIVVVTYIRYPIAAIVCPTKTSLSTK